MLSGSPPYGVRTFLSRVTAAAITQRAPLQGWKIITKNVLQTNELVAD
jgi:hypothetical protein